jgi:hypothetical protein
MLRLIFHADNVPGAFAFKGRLVREALRAEVDKLDEELQSKIVGGPLNGAILKRRTGKLAGSVRVVPATIGADNIHGQVQAGGGPAFYGRFQEDGTRGPYPIRPRNKKALAFFPQGAADALGSGKSAQQVFQGKRGVNRTIRSATKASALGSVVVKGVMHPGLSPRYFMRDSFEAFKPTIKNRLQITIRRALTASPSSGVA